MQPSYDKEPLIRAVDRALFALLDDREPALLYEPMRYLIESGGKRFRPLLCIRSCQLVGGTQESCIPAAVAVELAHNYTLIHDDIMDHDDLRRGRPTVHKKWDEAVGILAGDGLIMLACQTLLNTGFREPGLLLRLFTDGLLTVCEGQALDKAFEKNAFVSMDMYRTMIAYKTARLLEVACELGVLIGNGSTEAKTAVKCYAHDLGMAFQIRDDLLDIVDESGSGKTYGSDIIEKKKTYLTLSFLLHAPESEKRKLLEIWEAPRIGREEIETVRKLFEENGILKRAEQAVEAHAAACEKHLAFFEDSEAKNSLIRMAAQIRDKL